MDELRRWTPCSDWGVLCDEFNYGWSIFSSMTLVKVNVLVAQLCLTLCNPMDCSLLGSSVHEIFQWRILEWVAVCFSKGSFWPRDQTQVSFIAGRFFTIWANREAPKIKLCPTLCNSRDYSPPGSSVHGILQAKILEKVAISFSRGSTPPRDQTQVSYIAGRFFTIWVTRE